MALLKQVNGLKQFYMNTKHSNCKLIAHRGLSGVAPENTIPAFLLAGELNYYGAECDVQVTKDGHFVVFHDDTVERMTNGEGQIGNMTLAELELLEINSGSNINYFKSNQQVIRIPTIQDYLTVCKNHNLVPVIEIKEINQMSDLDTLVSTLSKFDILDEVIIISFKVEYLIKLRKLLPKLKLQYIVNEIEHEMIKLCKKYKLDIDANALMLYKHHIEACHKEGIKVNTWTVDEQDIAKYLMDAGIDYITTNILHDNR